tara:strand:- start:189 stop:560 length:372 start_codon:yes stop_codon:yes gene_type:complete
MINERNLDDLKITLNNLKKSIKEVEDVVDRIECPRDWSQSIYTSTVNLDNEVRETYDLYENVKETSIYDSGSGATETSLVMNEDEMNNLQLKFDFDEENLKLQEVEDEVKNVVQFPFPNQYRP